jgi:hypothetical protein
MLDEKNLDRTDAMGRQFGEMKKQVLPPPALEKAVIEGVPYGKPVLTRVHVLRITKAVAAYVVGIALFLGMVLVLPSLWEGKSPVGTNPSQGTITSIEPYQPKPLSDLTLPTAHFYITRQGTPEEIGELFGQAHSPELSAWFPVIRIDSVDALQEFYDKADQVLSLDNEATASFSSAKASEYDKSYFKRNVLAIGYFNSSVQSYGYALTMYSKVRDTITFGVSDYGGLVDYAFAGNLMVVELARSEISGVKDFGAYLDQSKVETSVEDRKTVVEIEYGGIYRFSGVWAGKLTRELAELDYGKSEISNPKLYKPIELQTVNGSYTYLVTRNEVLHGDRSAKYAMSSTLKRILDHYPSVPVMDFVGTLGNLSRETEKLIAEFAEPTVEGMNSVVRLDSWEELREFLAATDEEFRMAENTAALDAFLASKIGELGKDFFDGYSLLVSGFDASSGSFSYYLTDVRITPDHALIMEVQQNVFLSYAPTMDVVRWSASIRIPTELLIDVEKYGCQ